MATSPYREGYTKSHRTLEIASIVGFFILSALNAKKLYLVTDHNHLPLLAFGFFIGMLGADFVSGFVHWAADTWGSPDWPIVGQSLIRSFREHHVDPEEITRHDFVETNGNNCLVSLPVLLVMLLISLPQGASLTYFILTSLFSLTLWIFLTNQFHKWAHKKETEGFTQLLQKARLILSKDHHQIHHVQPFVDYYCITNGWLNYPLRKLRFFRHLEFLITKVTGALPRESDAEEQSSRQSSGKLESDAS